MVIERERLVVIAAGRPAPQGSKAYGAAGQMREASRYLGPWRQAVQEATFRAYGDVGWGPDDMRRECFLGDGPVGFDAWFWLDPANGPIDRPPDLDKLIRAVWDELTKCRVWRDDGSVVKVGEVRKAYADEVNPPGVCAVAYRVGR